MICCQEDYTIKYTFKKSFKLEENNKMIDNLSTMREMHSTRNGKYKT
jgi:hypothetical protein